MQGPGHVHVQASGRALRAARLAGWVRGWLAGWLRAEPTSLLQAYLPPPSLPPFTRSCRKASPLQGTRLVGGSLPLRCAS